MVSYGTLLRMKQALDRKLKGAPTPTVRRTLKQAITLARRLATELRDFGDTLPAARLEGAIASGLIGQINFIIDWATMGTTISNELKPGMRTAYLAGAKDADKKFRSDGVAISFNAMNLRAEEWASRYSGRLITEITEDQRVGVSRLVEAAQRDGRTPQETARDIRNIVGLHSRQVTALERYRASLVADGTPPEKVARLTDKYSMALLRQRSMVIARTELLRATHEGQVQLAREGIIQGAIDKSRTFKQWIVTDDDLLDTELCLPMSEPDLGEVRIDEAWTLPDGREAWTPQDSHPNCRCTFAMIVKHDDDE